MNDKIKKLCDLLTKDGQKRLTSDGIACDVNLENAIAYSKDGKKYVKIDTGGSGRYMVEKSTGIIYGIKAYGQIHRGHSYGTLDTINEWYWGNYTAYKKQEAHNG